MKHTTPKKSQANDFILLKKTDINILFKKLLFTICLFLFLSVLFNAQANSWFSPQQQKTQVPAKKIIVAKPVKKVNPKTKTKKSNIIRKDTIIDIDPANTSSPLYQKTNNQ